MYMHPVLYSDIRGFNEEPGQAMDWAVIQEGSPSSGVGLLSISIIPFS